MHKFTLKKCIGITSLFFLFSNILIAEEFIFVEKNLSFFPKLGIIVLVFFMSVPAFFVVTLILTCLIAFLITLINKFYSFKRVYLSTLFINSIQLFVNLALFSAFLRYNLNLRLLSIMSFMINIFLVAIYRNLLIKFANVNSRAANILSIFGIVLSIIYLVVGVK